LVIGSRLFEISQADRQQNDETFDDWHGSLLKIVVLDERSNKK
jgi:hypothetical protein